MKETKELDSRYKELHDKYFDWLERRSRDEKKLYERALAFEERYFKDMRLESFSKRLTEMQDAETGIVYQEGFDQAFDLSVAQWRYVIKGDLDSDGRCNGSERVIEIHPNHEKNNEVLLHEMIHAYEFLLFEASPSYGQYVLLALYNKLSKKVPGLMKLVTLDSHIALNVHTPLFMLKSIDLDIRLRRPLGTIYEYDRLDLFRKKSKSPGEASMLKEA